jgi:predicted site-specific integrase-resolvase
METDKVNIKLVSPEVLAGDLEVEPKTVKRWAAEGRIPAHHLTRKIIRFDRAAVLRALGVIA